MGSIFFTLNKFAWQKTRGKYIRCPLFNNLHWAFRLFFYSINCNHLSPIFLSWQPLSVIPVWQIYSPSLFRGFPNVLEKSGVYRKWLLALNTSREALDWPCAPNNPTSCPLAAGVFLLNCEDEGERPALSADWLVIGNQFRRWIDAGPKQTVSGVGRKRLHAHWHLWSRGILGTQDDWTRPKGLSTKQSVTRPRWIAWPPDRSPALWVGLFYQTLGIWGSIKSIEESRISMDSLWRGSGWRRIYH